MRWVGEGWVANKGMGGTPWLEEEGGRKRKKKKEEEEDEEDEEEEENVSDSG
jgi:hypothetical protein